VSRRLVVLVAVLATALLVVPAAFALRVHVRVEGKTQTIYGSTEPTLSVRSTALDSLDSASVAGEFYYHVTTTSFGPYVDQVGRYVAGGSNGWVFKVNGVSPPVGADKVTLKDGDRVLWYWSTFSSTGQSQKTLLLTRAARNCYRVVAEDDTGAKTAPSGATLRVDGRTKRMSGGSACVGKHRGLVRAFAAGAIRSNALA
jgi:hypothetical protein